MNNDDALELENSSEKSALETDIDMTGEPEFASDVTDEPEHKWPEIPSEVQAELVQSVEKILNSVAEQEWEDTASELSSAVEEVIMERFFPNGFPDDPTYDEIPLALYAMFALTEMFLEYELHQLSTNKSMLASGIANLRNASKKSAQVN